MSVEDDAEQGTTASFAGGAEDSAAVRECGVIGEDSADSGEDGVGGVAKALDFGAGSGASEPVRLVGSAVLLGGSEVAVD